MRDIYEQVAEEFAAVYTILYDESLDPSELEVSEVEDPADEAAILLPTFTINSLDWQGWNPERKLEVYIHEAAHTANYEDDHEHTFWERVADLTEIAVANTTELSTLFEQDYDGPLLYQTVIDSVHPGVIESNMAEKEVKEYLNERFYS